MKVTWERVSWLIGFHHNVGKTLTVLLLTRMRTTFANIIMALKMALVKLVGKTFIVCWKSVKTMKLMIFYHITFVSYSTLKKPLYFDENLPWYPFVMFSYTIDC